MDFYKQKLTYISLKCALETSKYKKNYEKSKDKNSAENLFDNRLRVNSHTHLRKPSVPLKKNIDSNDLYSGSVIYHTNHISEVNFEECLRESAINPEKSTQTDLKPVRNAEISEFDQLKQEVLDLKTEILEIQKFLHLKILRKNRKILSKANKENLSDPNYNFS